MGLSLAGGRDLDFERDESVQQQNKAPAPQVPNFDLGAAGQNVVGYLGKSSAVPARSVHFPDKSPQGSHPTRGDMRDHLSVDVTSKRMGMLKKNIGGEKAVECWVVQADGQHFSFCPRLGDCV